TSMTNIYGKAVDRFVVPSRFYIQKFQEWGINTEKFVHIPNFVDVSSVEPATSLGEYYFYFGRLAKEKGLVTLVQTFRESGRRLVIAGGGAMEAELKAMAGDASNIEFVGVLDGSGVAKFLTGARAVVVPSEWYENCPMAVIEAFGHGKPVIASDIGGLPEMVIDGETGFVFTPGDCASLESAIERYEQLSDPAKLSLGKAVREFAEENYSPSVYTEKVSELYSELRLKS
ncbi:MAG: glycosyltransferase family 4 protein, partial [Pseudomonadota bacterium]